MTSTWLRFLRAWATTRWMRSATLSAIRISGEMPAVYQGLPTMRFSSPLPERYRFLLFEDKCEVLTKNWTDWVDYWAVDFNFESKREIIRVKSEETGSGKNSGRGITSASPTLRNTRMPTGVTT